MLITRTKKAALAALAALGFAFAPVPATMPVQAIDLSTIGTIASAGAYYVQLNKQLSYLDNEGRNAYMDQVKEKYGVNSDPAANAMTARVMNRLSAAIAKSDPLVAQLKAWVDDLYDNGRQSGMSRHELEQKLNELAPGRFSN